MSLLRGLYVQWFRQRNRIYCIFERQARRGRICYAYPFDVGLRAPY